MVSINFLAKAFSGEDSVDKMSQTTELNLETMESKAILAGLLFRIIEKNIFKKNESGNKERNHPGIKNSDRLF